jgi:hypothetical protein
VACDAKQREILRQAIDDAVYYRDPPQKCESSSGLCSRCAETLAIGLKYLRTARELGLGWLPPASDRNRPPNP